MQSAGWLESSRKENTVERAKLRDGLLAMGLETPVSHANFVLPDFESAEEAARIDGALRAQGILVRAVGGYGLPTRLRISVGQPSDNQLVLKAIGELVG